MKRKNLLKNEAGALSFEFLGILPFYFMFFLLLWQVVASGYTVFTAKTAVNEAAKTYALTNDIEKAREKARQIIGDGSIIKYKGLDPVDPPEFTPTVEGEFKLKLEIEHFLVFLPENWRKSASIPLDETATGTEIIP